ncbi:NUDIX domain-containing protein [Synechococcus sp. H55.10]|uniref:NUDIX domain-containing protein n=1 Tax=Synechococcus sp. H55.10 TaxID=2964503 RepID=UPI0039C5E4AD
MRPPRLTVAVLAWDGQRLLFVEEEIEGRRVLNQPAGRVEAGESLLQAASRETLEETGWMVQIEALVGVYEWRDVDRHTVRFAFAARPIAPRPGVSLDPGIRSVLWLEPERFRSHPLPHRSPLVARCAEDFLRGRRLPLDQVVCDLGNRVPP